MFNLKVITLLRHFSCKNLLIKKRISYLCSDSDVQMKRELIYSPAYLEFISNSNERTKEKLNYAAAILENLYPIPTKFVKKLVNTDFYEMRVSVDNEVRVILFSVDNENINLSKTIVFLNGFIKKSTKDYDAEIVKAVKILRDLL